MERNIDYKKLDEIVLLKQQLDRFKEQKEMLNIILMGGDLNKIKSLRGIIDIEVTIRSIKEDSIVIKSSKALFDDIELMKEIMKNIDLKISIIETQIEELLS